MRFGVPESIRRIQENILLASHNPTDIKELSDAVYRMENGRIIGFGIFGYRMRLTHTDLTSNPDYKNELQLAELPLDFAINDFKGI